MAAAAPLSKSLRKDAREILLTCPALNSTIAARRLTAFFDREIASSGLTAEQLGVLAHLAALEEETLGALARRTGIRLNILSALCQRLAGAGVVEIATLEPDPARCPVSLTPAGISRLATAIPLWRKAHAKLATHLLPTLARHLVEKTEAVLD